MTQIRKLKIEIPIEEVYRAQGNRKKVTKHLAEETEKCIRLAYQLIEPAILYDFVDVRVDAQNGVGIKTQGTMTIIPLDIKKHLDLFQPAEMALVAIHTIGPKLEQQVRNLNQSSDYLQGYVLDCVGLVALRQTGKAVKVMAEEKASQLGCGVSPSLSPGSLEGWDLQDQKVLCSMLDLDKGSLQLSNACVLIPHKSVSTFIGIGPAYKKKRVGSICHLCRLQETCWQRRY